MAMAAGATGKLVDLIVQRMVEERKIRLDRAKELVEQYQKTGKI
jgi:hydroxymethylglutaryl-CoA reductase